MFRVILAALAVVLLLSACGGGGTDVSTNINDVKAVSCVDPYQPITCLKAGQDILVGGLFGYIDGNTLKLEYRITEPGWGLIEVHTHVAASPDDFPMTEDGNPIPGQFMYQAEDLGGATTHAVEFLIDGAWCPVYIAAHAAVEKIDELLYNEGFELPVIGGDNTWTTRTNAQVAGWDVTWTHNSDGSPVDPENPPDGNLEYWHNLSSQSYPAEGDQNVELDSHNHPNCNNVMLSQTFDSLPGKCVLSFAWRPRVLDTRSFTSTGGFVFSGYDCEMEVYWDNDLIGTFNPSTFDEDHSDKNAWQYESFDLNTKKVDDPTLRLKETGVPNNGGGLGTLLDAVSVLSTQDETAWSCGEDFPGENWATYTVYTGFCPPVE